MLPPKISIIILQFNNSQDTIKCLESVKELDYNNLETIIIDNASEVKHFNAVRFFIESQEKMGEGGLKLVTNKSNLGYAGGNNIGIRYALENGADFVLILNPDTVVKKDLLKKLIKSAERKRTVGIIGPATRETGKTAYCGKIRWLKPELEHSTLKPKTCNLKPNQYIPGAAMLVSKKVFKKIGMFDERYFLYFEDADFCVRAQGAGFKLIVAPDAIVHHNSSSSTSKLGAALLLRYHYRNAHLFNVKNAPLKIKVLLPFWSIWIIMKQAVKILLGRNTQASKAILNGVLDFYRGQFGKIVLDTNSRIKNE